MKATRTYRRRPNRDRLYEKLAETPTGCLEFMGARLPAGYGVIQRGGRDNGVTGAHRMAWELERGPIPPGMDVCHKCDNPPCCNVDHLFLGTRQVNVRDAWTKGRASAPPLHRGETHPNAAAPDNVVRACREEVAAGARRADVALKYGVNLSAVNQWVTGKCRLEAGGPIHTTKTDPRAAR